MLAGGDQYVGVKRIVRDGVCLHFIDNQHYFFRGHVYGDFDDDERALPSSNVLW